MTKQINLKGYEGVYSDRPPPGEYQVITLEPKDDAKSDVVVTIPTLTVHDRTLVCEYSILVPDLNDENATCLIIAKILAELLCDRHRAKADEIVFHNLNSGAKCTVHYPK